MALGNLHQWYLGKVKSYSGATGVGFIDSSEAYQTYGQDVHLARQDFVNSGAEVNSQVRFQVEVSGPDSVPYAKSVSIVAELNSGPGALGPTHGAAPPEQRRVGPVMPPPARRNSDPSLQGLPIGAPPSAAIRGPPIGPPPAGFKGFIKVFHQDQGYGYVESEDCQRAQGLPSSEIYLHYSEAIDFRVGDHVTFDVKWEDNQAKAVGLKKAGGSAAAGPAADDSWFSDVLASVTAVVAGAKGAWDSTGAGVGKGAAWGGSAPGEAPAYGAAREVSQYEKGKGKGKGKHGGFPIWREFSGLIKSYNPEKGYGFIDNDEIKGWFNRDCFLTKGEVDRHGLNVGEDVTFVVKIDRGNPQADVIGKTNEMHMLGQDSLASVGPGPHKGVIKSYNDTKGFGFIQCEETYNVFECDVFMHKREMDPSHQVRNVFCARDSSGFLVPSSTHISVNMKLVSQIINIQQGW